MTIANGKKEDEPCKKTTRCRFEVACGVKNGQISNGKAPRTKRNGSSNTKVAVSKKKASNSKLSMKSEVFEGKVVITLPLRTKSEANCFEHWRLKQKRHKEQQRLVAIALKPIKKNIKLPCKVMLTRFAPHELDAFENLPMSFKYIVDAICAIITGDYRPGRADGDKRISLACDQVKSKEYGVRIEITF